MSSFAGDCEMASHAGDISSKEAEVGILPSHGISLDLPDNPEPIRPPIIQHLQAQHFPPAHVDSNSPHSSSPAYQSPIRHHRRGASQHREVKETLNARSEYTNNEKDGRSEHHLNQYLIKDEIGRGSFGAVHLAVDQYGKEYAVKEFSKSRLRKRAQSNILRRPHGMMRRRPGHLAAGSGLNSPLHRHSASDIHSDEEQGNPLFLIKEEIAIMKKLDHPNLVSLIEVLDDPDEDSLYMVLEMCKKGVIMKVGLGEKADPYDSESCRCWFRDLILGIEYLHAQGVVHRDIKPDNLLLTEDDVLKIVDFGVSEMFEKASDMRTAKSAGSPAFLPPELCVTNHGDISGRAADIWSMGICLYCLRFGRIPFERSGVLELYDSIKNDQVEIESSCEPEFCDLLHKLLDKDPKTRITMPDLREHPWVTKNGADPLLSAEENTADLVEPPSDIEVNHAITQKMRNLLVMMKAVKKFKDLIYRKRPEALASALGKGVRAIHPLGGDATFDPPLQRSKSDDADDRRNVQQALAAEGVHQDVGLGISQSSEPTKVNSPAAPVQHSENEPSTHSHRGHKPHEDQLPQTHYPELHSESSGEKGHAHDPLEEPPLFLGIGSGGDQSLEPIADAVAESPTAAEFNIYNTAYQEEVERIRASQGNSATVYLTRRVDDKKEYKADVNMVEAPKQADIKGRAHEGFKSLLDRTREKQGDSQIADVDKVEETSQSLSNIAHQAIDNTKAKGKEIGEKGVVALGSLTQNTTAIRKEIPEERETETR